MKAAPLIDAVRADGRMTVRLIHTGQHFDENMSKVFFQELNMPEPDVYLNIHCPTHIEQIGRCTLALEPEINQWKPDIVAVVGDVNSTLAAAIASNKTNTRLAHVEAGLRSFDRSMPEEINRLIVDQLADFLFTPSKDGDANLIREGIPAEKIHRVGNIMVDTLLRFRERAEKQKTWEKYHLKPRNYGVVTIHRPANVDEPQVLDGIVAALVEISKKTPLIFPIHPRTRKAVVGYKLQHYFQNPNITISIPYCD